MFNIYVTSTIREEGKTFVTAGLAATMQSLGYSTCVYKPVQTNGIDINGFTQSQDLTFVKSLDPYINTAFTYLFKSNAEPLIAAENENGYIDIDAVNNDYKKVIDKYECTLVDGDSGLFSPLSPSVQNIDLVKKIQTPVLMIVEPNENTINNTLTTIFSAQEKGVCIRGVVINNIKPDTSKELLTSITRVIEEYSGVSILGLLQHLDGKITPEDIITSVLNGIDIESVFDVKIEKLDFN